MLTGGELAIAIAVVLLGAVSVGALLHWVWIRMAGTDPAVRLEQMGEQLHQAEMAREAADLARQEAETARAAADLARQEAEAQLALGERQAEARMAALEARLEGAVAEQEDALARELSEAWAELEAVRDRLAHARQRIQAPRAEGQ